MKPGSQRQQRLRKHILSTDLVRLQYCERMLCSALQPVIDCFQSEDLRRILDANEHLEHPPRCVAKPSRKWRERNMRSVGATQTWANC